MAEKREENVLSRRQVFREDILNTIREAIFAGELKPGDRVIETYWARELGVSQGPVREAIRDLEALGLVETVPFKGSHVRTLTKKDVQDNYSVRMCLEVKSIRDVIHELPDEDLKELVEELKKIILEMDKCAKEADLRSFTECDTRFHRAIIEATDNKVLLKLWSQCNMRNWYMVEALTDSASLKQLQVGHNNILKAISVRNVKEATSIMEGHLIGLMNGYIDAME